MTRRFNVNLTRRVSIPSIGLDFTEQIPDQFDRITDERTGTHRPKPPNGWLNPTAYFRTTEWYPESFQVNVYGKRTSPYVSETWINGRDNLGGSIYSRVPPAPDILEQRLLTKARLDLKDQKVNFSQAMAERKLTAGLVTDSLGKLIKGARAVRRGQFRKAAQAFGVPFSGRHGRGKPPRGAEFFNSWLEFQYGWKPLYQDVFGAVTVLSKAEQIRRGEVRAHVKASGSEFDRSTREVAEPWLNGGYCWFAIDAEVQHKAKVRLDFAHTSPSFSTAQELGLTNPAQLAWELVPFSFVVDWFLPVGDFLSQLDATVGWTFKGGSYSEKSVMTQSARFSRMEGLNPGFSGYGSAIGKTRQMSFARTVYETEPMAVIPAPKRWDQAFSPTHVANAIALFGSIFLGGLKVR